MSAFKSRIIQYLEYKGLTKYDFYKKTGVSNGVLSQKSGLSEDNALKFLNYFKDINPTWFFSGKGDMLKKPHEYAPEDRGLLTVNDKNPEYRCENCGEKNLLIETLQKLTENQQELIAVLKEKLKKYESSEDLN